MPVYRTVVDSFSIEIDETPERSAILPLRTGFPYVDPARYNLHFVPMRKVLEKKSNLDGNRRKFH